MSRFIPPRHERVPAGFSFCVAPFAYASGVESVVLAVKRTNQHALTHWMSTCIASLVPSVPADTVVTWAPTSVERRRQRGYDHGELLARAVARTMRLVAVNLLVREADPSTGRSHAERSLVRFSPHRSAEVYARSGRLRTVLLIDDVRTTGATLHACAHVLSELHMRGLASPVIGGATFAVTGG